MAATHSYLHHLVLCAFVGVTTTACPSENVDHSCDQESDSPFVVDTQTSQPMLGFQVCDSAAVDLNNDGRLDLVAANHRDPGFGMFMTGTDERFGAGTAVSFVDPAASNSAGIVAGDFNADGWVDVANSNHDGTVTVRMNATQDGDAVASFPGSGETTVDLGLNHADSHGFAGIEGGLATADFDGDGDLDIATANLASLEGDPSRYTATVLFNTTVTGDPVSTWNPAPLYLDLPAPSISLDTADFNRDGRPDMVVAVTAGSALALIENATTSPDAPSFLPALDLTIPAGDNSHGAGPTNAVVGQFTDDEFPDVASANWNVDTVTIFRNTTTVEGDRISFAAEPLQVIQLCFNPLVVRVGDVDGDGDDDIFVVPLDVTQPVAGAIIRNRTGDEGWDPAAPFELARTLELPQEMHPDESFLAWLEGKTDSISPPVWFASSGNIADFDGDGDDDIALLVAKGPLPLEIQPLIRGTDDVLAFVDPVGPTALAEEFLPDESRLVHYVVDP